MNRKSLILLILCNLVWATNPLMGKILVGHFTGVQVAWIRYMGAFVSFLLVALGSIFFGGRKWSEFFLVPTRFQTLLQLALVGLGPFVFAPIMQFLGLETAGAMDNAILIATEPLLTVVMAWIVLNEKMTRDHWISMGIALLGFLLFGGFIGHHVGISLSMGMVFLVFAQLGEGTYSVLSRKLVQHHSPLAILGTGLTIGAAFLTFFVFSFDGFPNLLKMEGSDIGAAVWLGPIGSTVTYLVWATIAKTVSVPSMAITLFIQPVVGAVLGYVILDERLTLSRGFGAGLILLAIVYLSVREIWKEQNKDEISAPGQKKNLR